MKGTRVVHIICWDDVRYDREATSKEISTNRKLGFVYEYDNEITFDFRTGAILRGRSQDIELEARTLKDKIRNMQHDIELAIKFEIGEENYFSYYGHKITELAKILDNISKWKSEEAAERWLDYREELEHYGYTPSQMKLLIPTSLVKQIIRKWAQQFAPKILSDVKQRISVELSKHPNISVKEVTLFGINGRMDASLFAYGVNDPLYDFSKSTKWWKSN